MVALGSNLSALWILVANGWMQNPAGAAFNPRTMRMEVTDFKAVLFNPVAQAKFVHTVSAGYLTAAVFVAGVSAILLLQNKWPRVAKRSMTVAASFGLAAAFSVVVLGDESGYNLTDNQKMKLAALEAMWNTEPAPAGLTVFGFPNVADRTTHAEIKIPYVLGVIATRGLDRRVEGILPLVAKAESRVESGVIAYDAVERLKVDPRNPAAIAQFEAHRGDLGYGLLLKRYVADPRTADAATIQRAAWDTVPNVPMMFILFRVMAVVGFFFIAFFGVAFTRATTQRWGDAKWFLRIAVLVMPLPWIAMESGWVLAELGRQPWAVEGVLPTFLGASSLTAPQIWATIVGFTLLYGALAVVEIGLIVRTVRRGPYARHQEASAADAAATASAAH
jgi:cytochrome d ubiquinol oxidase subunit I